MTYRAFFSYARADERIANWLHRQLDWFRTPRSLVGTHGAFGPIEHKLHPIFRDRTDLQAGGQIDAVLQQALEDSDALVVLCSPTSAKSKWVNHECETFIRLGRQSRIFPVIADGEPNSGDPNTECFPPALRGTGLLAADLREIHQSNGQIIGDGKETGRLKLIAGLLGIPLDTLVRRERQRQRTTLAILGVSAVIFLLTAIVAITQSFSASNNARIATEQRNEAILSLGRVTAQQAWRALDEDNITAAARFGLAGIRISPTLSPHYRDVLAAALFDAGHPRIIARFATSNRLYLEEVSSDARRALFIAATNWGSLELLYIDLQTGSILDTDSNVGCDMHERPRRISFDEMTYTVTPCRYGARRVFGEAGYSEGDVGRGSGVTASIRTPTIRIEGDRFGWVQVYDIESGRRLFARRLHDGEVEFLRVIGDEIISYGADGRLLAWSPRYERRAAYLIDDWGTDNIWGGDVSWTADGNHVVYLSAGRPIQFNASTGEVSQRIERYGAEARSIAGDALALIDRRQILIRNPAAETYINAQDSQGNWGSLTVSPSRLFFAAMDAEQRAGIWRATGELQRFEDLGDDAATISLADSGEIAVGTHDGLVRFASRSIRLFEQASPVTNIHVSTTALVGSNRAGYLATYGLTEAQQQNAWRAHEGEVTALDVSPNGLLIASSGTDGWVRIWNATTGNRLAQFQLAVGNFQGLPSVAFSPDSQFLAISRNDNSAEIWSVTVLTDSLEDLQATICRDVLTSNDRSFSVAELEANDFLGQYFVQANDVCAAVSR